MNAEITAEGVLRIIPLNGIEQYALKMWFENYYPEKPEVGEMKMIKKSVLDVQCGEVK